MKAFSFVLLPAAAATALFLAGCADQSGPSAPQQTPAVDTSAVPAEEQSEEVREALAGLSPEDRALAEKQKICPVAGEPLGSMGTPYKVTVNGRDVLLCCDGCEEEIKAHPDQYLAKLPK